MFCLFPDTWPETSPNPKFSTKASLSTPAFPDQGMSMVHSLLLGVTLVSPTNAQHSGKAPAFMFSVSPTGPGSVPSPEVTLIDILFNSCRAHLVSLWRRPSSGCLLNASSLCGPSASREVPWPRAQPALPLGTRKGKEAPTNFGTRKPESRFLFIWKLLFLKYLWMCLSLCGHPASFLWSLANSCPRDESVQKRPWEQVGTVG